MTVSELLQRASSAELTEWFAYFHVKAEPVQKEMDPEEHSRLIKQKLFKAQ